MGPAIRRSLSQLAPEALSVGGWPPLALDLLSKYRPATPMARAKAAIATGALSLIIFSNNQPAIRKEILGKNSLPALVFTLSPQSAGAVKHICAYGQYLSHFFQKCAESHGTAAAFLAAKLAKDSLWAVSVTLVNEREARTKLTSTANRSKIIHSTLSLACGYHTSLKTTNHDEASGITPAIASFLTMMCATYNTFDLLSRPTQLHFGDPETESMAVSLVDHLAKRDHQPPKSIRAALERNTFVREGYLRAIRRNGVTKGDDESSLARNVSMGKKMKVKHMRTYPIKHAPSFKVTSVSPRTRTNGRICRNCSNTPPRPCKRFWRDNSGDLARCARGRDNSGDGVAERERE